MARNTIWLFALYRCYESVLFYRTIAHIYPARVDCIFRLYFHTALEAIIMTFINLVARNSLATGPITRVAIGPERSRLMSTPAFSWKRT